MTKPWWDIPGAEPALNEGTPQIMPGGATSGIARLHARIAGFTPEWRDLSEEDAGVALVRLFGVQLEPVLARLERVPDKALRELLSAAGISLAAPLAARTRVRFLPKENNALPVMVPQGFRLRSARADGEDGDVTWETEGPLQVANCSLAELVSFDGELAKTIESDTPFLPFEKDAPVGSAFYLGFDGQGDLRSTLSLAVQAFASEAASPVARGGSSMRSAPPPRLVWEHLGPSGFEILSVKGDDTERLTRDGIVRLEMPSNWSSGRPDPLGEGDPRHWIRLRLASGSIAEEQQLTAIVPHVVEASAVETHRNEFPVAEGDGLAKTARLAQTPVVSGSIVLDVDEGAAAGDLFEIPESTGPATDNGNWRRWEEAETLSGAGADARVFTLDPLTGELVFGDNINGAALPPGIRGVAVRSYQTTAGAGANVAAGDIDRMFINLEGIDEVANIEFASGGLDTETIASAEARGPGDIKARGRAVTAKDISQLALEAPGGQALRVIAKSGIDPNYPSAQIPGTIGLFVLARRHPSQPVDTPPYATSVQLAAIADHIASGVGPVGSRVSVGNPDYQTVGIDGTIVLAEGANAQAVAAVVRGAIDTWLNPEIPDPAYGSWTLGERLAHADLTHLVLGAHPDILAAPYLSFRVDNIRGELCADAQLRRLALPWPGSHNLIVEFAGGDA